MNTSSRRSFAGRRLTNLHNTVSKPGKRRYDVLIADDSDADRFLLRKAIDHAASLNAIAEVPDGAGVVAYLRGQGEFSNRRKFPIPDLLLLDLNMPGMDGFAVLEWLGTQEFHNLTVMVLTGSLQPQDLKRALDLGAHRFQVKPRSIEDWHATIHVLERYLQGASRPAHSTISRLSSSIA